MTNVERPGPPVTKLLDNLWKTRANDDQRRETWSPSNRQGGTNRRAAYTLARPHLHTYILEDQEIRKKERNLHTLTPNLICTCTWNVHLEISTLALALVLHTCNVHCIRTMTSSPTDPDHNFGAGELSKFLCTHNIATIMKCVNIKGMILLQY